MIIDNRNLAFSKLELANNGDTFSNCNIMQVEPYTSIAEGKQGLTFENCNLLNCSVPVDSIIQSCQTLQVNKCTNLHPLWAELSETPCDIDCEHLTEKETVNIEFKWI